MSNMQQGMLIQLSDSEKLNKVCSVLRERGQHSMYCCWENDKYNRDLGCTCGLDDGLELCAEILPEEHIR